MRNFIGLDRAVIGHGQSATTNLAWGGDDWKTMFITTRNTLHSVQMNIPGIPVPVGQ